jgi:hypothetical protein
LKAKNLDSIVIVLPVCVSIFSRILKKLTAYFEMGGWSALLFDRSFNFSGLAGRLLMWSDYKVSPRVGIIGPSRPSLVKSKWRTLHVQGFASTRFCWIVERIIEFEDSFRSGGLPPSFDADSYVASEIFDDLPNWWDPTQLDRPQIGSPELFFSGVSRLFAQSSDAFVQLCLLRVVIGMASHGGFSLLVDNSFGNFFAVVVSRLSDLSHCSAL